MFIETIKKSVGEELCGGFRATMFGGNAVYFTGVGGIKSFNGDKVVLSLKKGQIVIVGENLTIKKICEGDTAVCGKISSLSIE